MDFWTAPVPATFKGANAELDEPEVGFGDRLASDTGANAPSQGFGLGSLLNEGQSLLEPLVDEWNTTQAAFFDAIHSKASSGVASTERNFQESVARGASGALTTYFNLSSGIASGFVKAVDSSFTGLPKLATAPIETLQSITPALLAMGITYATSDTQGRLHMLASGASQFGVGAAMWRTGDFEGAPATARPQNALASEAAAKLEATLGEGLYTPNPLKAETIDTARPAEGSTDLAAFFGSAHFGGSPRPRRDLSGNFVVKAPYVADYPVPRTAGVFDHYIKGELWNGNLWFTVKNSNAPGAAERFGYGNEMFAGLFRAYEKADQPITSITGSWRPKDGARTNFDQFIGGINDGLSPAVAASRTFTGRQAADFGFTRVLVPRTPQAWATQGVDVVFQRPDWGPDSSWANYANVWVRAMGQR